MKNVQKGNKAFSNVPEGAIGRAEAFVKLPTSSDAPRK